MGKAKRLRAQRRAAPPPVGGRPPPGRKLWLGVGLLVVIVAVAVAVIRATSAGYTAAKPVDEAALSGLQAGPAPWRPEIASLGDRLRVLGLPALMQADAVVHIHQHLDLFVNGHRVAVPGGIGINDSSFISPIHTHDASGVIHVESPSKEHFALAQFFAIWGVGFTERTLGRYRSTLAHPIRYYVDGKLVSGDPRALILASHQEIAVVVGKPPAKVPASYSFPGGE